MKARLEERRAKKTEKAKSKEGNESEALTDQLGAPGAPSVSNNDFETTEETVEKSKDAIKTAKSEIAETTKAMNESAAKAQVVLQAKKIDAAQTKLKVAEKSNDKTVNEQAIIKAEGQKEKLITKEVKEGAVCLDDRQLGGQC